MGLDLDGGGGRGGGAVLAASCFGLRGGVGGVVSLRTLDVSLWGLGGGCGPLRFVVGLPVWTDIVMSVKFQE